MKPSQTDRVLAALRAHPERGITRVDFNLPDVIDNGPPILHIPGRIEELRNQGYKISSGERRQRCTVYRLVGEPALFDMPRHVPGFDELVPPARSAIYGEDAA